LKVSDLSPENVLGKICAIEDSFCHSDTIPEESVEDALVFYVTKGRMVVEHAPTDHLIDVTEEENLDFKVISLLLPLFITFIQIFKINSIQGSIFLIL